MNTSFKRGVVAVLGLCMAAGLPLMGTPVNWVTAANGTWENSGNWSGTIPNSSTAQASFGLSTGYTVTLGSNKSIGRLLFSGGGSSWNLTGSRIEAYGISSGGLWEAVNVSGNTTATIASNFRLRNSNSSTLALNIGSGSQLTMSGTISQSGTVGIVKTGGGILVLSGTNSYSGATTISQGTIQVNSSGALGSTTSTVQLGNANSGSSNISLLTGVSGITVGRNISVNNFGGTTTIGGTHTSGTSTFSGGVALNKAVTLTAATGGTVNFSGVISGTGAVTQTGGGTVQLSGTNTFTGNIAINGGTLRIASNSNLGNTANDVSLDGGTLNTTATLTMGTGRAITLGTGGGTLNVNSGTTTTVQGVISGSGNFVKAGSGTLTLTGNNTFTGTTTISAGTVQLNTTGGQALGGTTQVIINSGGTLVNCLDEQINASADMLLNGGTYDLAGHTETFDTLTYSANSTLDLDGCPPGALSLTNLVRTGGVLTITGYSTPGQLIASNTVDSVTLQNIYWSTQGITGAFQIAGGKIVPAPEPSTWFMGLALTVGACIQWMRRKAKTA